MGGGTAASAALVTRWPGVCCCDDPRLVPGGCGRIMGVAAGHCGRLAAIPRPSPPGDGGAWGRRDVGPVRFCPHAGQPPDCRKTPNSLWALPSGRRGAEIGVGTMWQTYAVAVLVVYGTVALLFLASRRTRSLWIIPSLVALLNIFFIWIAFHPNSTEFSIMGAAAITAGLFILAAPMMIVAAAWMLLAGKRGTTERSDKQ